MMRKRTNQLHAPAARPRELEALHLIDQRPGITIAELADTMN
jgi:hypothetical protein